MYGRRTGQNLRSAKALCVVLLFVFLMPVAGCRDGETGPGVTETVPFTLSLPAGAHFTYTAYTLDHRSPQIPSATKSSASWEVVSTQEAYMGRTGVTVIADSSRAGRDTLYLSATPAGDIYIYGFLARLTKRRMGYHIPRMWDRVASFSAGRFGSWTVGTADSLGQDVVYGSVAGTTEYYSATVDGVMEVFPTYRVDLTSSTLYASLWFSNTPSAIVRLLDEPDYQVDGQLRELVAITTQR